MIEEKRVEEIPRDGPALTDVQVEELEAAIADMKLYVASCDRARRDAIVARQVGKSALQTWIWQRVRLIYHRTGL